MRKKSILLVALPLLLTSCGGQSSEIPSSSASDGSSVIDSGNSSEEPIEEISSSGETYDFVSTEAYDDSAISVGGILDSLDLIVEYAIKGIDYSVSISISDYSISDIVVASSNPEVAVLEGDLVNGYTLHCYNVGGTIITIRSADDNYLLYRQAVNVKEALTADQLIDHMVNEVRYYTSGSVSFGDEYNITFVDETSGIFSAYESAVDYGSMTFTYEMTSAEPEQFIDLYGYYFTLTMDDSSSYILLSDMFVYATGELLLPYTNAGLVAFLWDVDVIA